MLCLGHMGASVYRAEHKPLYDYHAHVQSYPFANQYTRLYQLCFVDITPGPNTRPSASVNGVNFIGRSPKSLAVSMDISGGLL